MQPHAMQPPESPVVAPPPSPAPQPASKPVGLATTSLVLSIIGLLTVWLFGLGILLAIVSIVCGIIALAKHRGGKGMAIAGLIVSGVAILFGGALLLLSIVAYGGIQQRAQSSENASLAALTAKKAEAYNVIKGDTDAPHYPTYIELREGEVIEAQLDPAMARNIFDGRSYQVSDRVPVTYRGCPHGAVIEYWDASIDKARPIEVGNPRLCSL